MASSARPGPNRTLVSFRPVQPTHAYLPWVESRPVDNEEDRLPKTSSLGDTNPVSIHTVGPSHARATRARPGVPREKPRRRARPSSVASFRNPHASSQRSRQVPPPAPLPRHVTGAPSSAPRRPTSARPDRSSPRGRLLPGGRTSSARSPRQVAPDRHRRET